MADGDPLKLGQYNTASSVTELRNPPGGAIGGFTVTSTDVALIGVGGVAGGVGVLGQSYSPLGGGSGIGVQGRSNVGQGVVGQSTTGSGVLGTSEAGPGVEADSRKSAGLYGNSVDHVGVYAFSVNGNAVYGTSANGNGVFGFAQGSGSGVVGLSAKGLAGEFRGDVVVLGSLTVIGGSKSAAVPHPDGSHRQLYAVESPESWFEDFGEARLVHGKAEITLDPEFAALVRCERYHVFLSPMGDSKGLYISRRNRTGFQVREQQHGVSNLRFSFRVVARRKDIRGARLRLMKVPNPVVLIPPPETTQSKDSPQRRKKIALNKSGRGK